jgi:hypothetical protein
MYACDSSSALLAFLSSPNYQGVIPDDEDLFWMVAGHMDMTARSSSSVADAHRVSPAHDIKRTHHRANIFWLIEFFPKGFFSLIKRTNERYEQAIGQTIFG